MAYDVNMRTTLFGEHASEHALVMLATLGAALALVSTHCRGATSGPCARTSECADGYMCVWQETDGCGRAGECREAGPYCAGSPRLACGCDGGQTEHLWQRARLQRARRPALPGELPSRA